MVNNSTNINKTNNHLSPKESLNSDGQQFYQYQQNKQSPLTYRKFKQWWSTILPVSTKQTITYHLKKIKQWWSTILPISTKQTITSHLKKV